MRLRPASLLWTFTGAFLFVLLLGTLLQSLAVVGVMRPMARRWVESQGRLMASAGAEALGRALESEPPRPPVEVLRGVTAGRGLVHLVWLDEGANVAALDRPPVPGRPDIARAFAGRSWEPGDTLRVASRGPRRRPEAGERRPRRYVSSLVVVGVAPVVTEGTPAGTVVAYSHLERRPPWPTEWPRPNILYWPFAALLAGVAGFILFRVLAGRLRRLEEHAGRVAAGDLEARVANTGRDEVGRLGQSLNRMSESLQTARDRVQAAEAQRRRFLADVTHELSTPMTTIRGYAETLLDPTVPISSEEREQYMREIVEEARRMDLLVADLLDLARLEAGSAGVELTQLDWGAIARGITRRLIPLFREAGLRLTWHGPEGPVLARGDGRRLEQVLGNLLMNARRYVPQGGSVSVRMEVMPEGRVSLMVEDDGPGFPAADLPHVFDRFYRGDPSRSSAGIGLGLAIVKGIVESHGGTVRAENRPEGGARVVVDLPGLDDNGAWGTAPENGGGEASLDAKGKTGASEDAAPPGPDDSSVDSR